MSDFIGLLLQAKIDPESIQDIQSQINKMSKNSDAIKIDIKVNDEVLKDIKNLNKEIEGMINKTSKTVNISGDFDKMKIDMDAVGNIKKVATDITEEYGKQLQITQEIDEKQKELVTTRQKLTIDKEKQLKVAEQIQNAIAKTIKLRAEENRKLEERQAKASNKYLDNEYKQNQKIKERIELFQKEQEIKIRSAESRYGSLLDHNAIAKYRAELNKLSADMDNPERKIKDMRIELRGLESEAQNNKRALDLANKSAMSFGEALKTAAYKFGIWSAVTASYYKLIREIRNGIRFINEMDAALTEIGMVTNQTREQTAGLAQEYNDLAREMKVLTSEVTAGAVDFYRQGLSQEEVMERLRVNTMYSKIANIDFKESAELLTATVNSMGVEIERASDVFLYMGDATATSGAEIAKGFQKTGGAAAALGVEFEKVASWIATISAATREAAESIGSSINTILSRYSRLTETGFNEEDQTQINDVAKALNTINISIVDTQGNFKNFGDILDELHGKWGSLNDETKAYIANSLAGTRQQSRFYNLMNNYTESLDLYTESLEAAGTTQSKFQLYLESNQAVIDDFKAALEGLWIAIIDSDSIMNLIKKLTTLVDVLGSAIDKFGVFKSVMSVVIPIIGIKYVTSVAAATKATITQELAMAGITKSSIGLVGGFKLLIGQLLGVKTAADGATISFMGLNAAAGIIGVALAAIPLILVKIAQKSKDAEEAFNNALDNSQQINEEVKSLESLLTKQEELTKITNKSVEEKEELLKVQRELAQLYPELATGVDAEGNSIAENVQITKQLTDEKKRLLEQELLVIKTTADQRLPQLRQELEAMRAEADEIQRRLNTGNTKETKMIQGYEVPIDKTEELKDRLLELVEAQREHLAEIDKLEAGVKSYNQTLEENAERQKWARTEELAAQATKAQSIPQMQAIEKELKQLGFTSEDVANIVSGNLDLVKEKYKELDMQQIINLQTIQDLDATQKSAALSMLETSKQMTDKLITDTEARITAIQAEMNALIALTGGKIKQTSVISKKATHDDFMDAYNTGGLLGAMSVTARDESIDAQRELAKLKGDLREIDKALANVQSISASKTGGIKTPKTKKAKSEKDKPNILDSIDAEIRAIKIRNDYLEKTSDLLKEQLNLAKNIEGMEGLNEQHRITGQIIEHNQKLIQSYKDEQDALHKKANDIRNANKKYNIDSWFDANAEQTVAYINQYNRATKDQQQEMSKVFNQMQKVKKAWMESNQEAKNLVSTTKELERELSNIALKQEELVRNKVKELIELEKRNAYLDLERRQRIANDRLKAAKQEMEDEVKRKQDQIDKIQDEIDRIQESERARQESLKRAEYLEDIAKLENKLHVLQYKNLEDLSEEQAKLVDLEREREQALKRQERIQEQQIKLQELQLKLDNLRREKNIQQLTKMEDGTWQFEYVADERAIEDVNKQIKDANKSLEDLQKEHDKTIKDLKEQTLEDLQRLQKDYDEWERQNDIRRQIESKQRRIKQYQDEIKDLQDKYSKLEEITKEAFEREKENLDRFYTDIDLLTDEKMEELYETFDGNWSSIHGMLTGYFRSIASEYEALIATLSQPLPDPGGGGGSGGGDYGYYEAPSGGTSFIRGESSGGSSSKTDWSAMYMDARSKGDWQTMEYANRQANIERGLGDVVTSDKDIESIKRKYGGSYHTGGVVGDGSRDLPEAVNRLFNTKADEQMVKAKIGELFVPKENLAKYFVPNMQELVKSAVLSGVNLAMPKRPNTALAGAMGGDTVYYIEKLNVPTDGNFDKFIKDLSSSAENYPNKVILKAKNKVR